MTHQPIQAHLLIHRADVRRTTVASSGGGQWAESDAPFLTDRPCRRWPAGWREVERGRALGVDVTHACVFAPDDDVRRGDLVTVGGVEHEVIHVELPSVEGHHRKALLHERETGRAA